METKIVTVGPKAYSFHDQATGITICRGYKKELTPRQYNSRKIQRALATGHLVLVANQTLEPISEATIKKLVKKIQSQYKQGMEVAKVVKGYNLEQATAIAKEFSLEPEKGDTVESLITAIYEELSKSEE